MKNQQGVALITILLVVVIATVLGVSMTTDQHFAINRARTFFDQGIVHQYALGGEELARQILHQDFVDEPLVDHKSENWAATDLRFDFDQGEVEVLIEDLQSRINLNSLAENSTNRQLAKQRMISLLAEQGLDASYADRIIDWIDLNNSVSSLGAEDYDYLGLERPYRTANTLMVDLSELRLILEMDREKFDQLSPYVTTIADPNMFININTVSPQVLVAIAPGLSISAAESVISERDANGGFQSLDELTGNPSLGADAAKNIKTAALSVQSSFFQVSVRARFQDRYGFLTSIVQRDPADGTLRVIYRDQGKKVRSFIAVDQDE
ncbi:MAG: general secretion pathway protein K [Patiriisocius sp.]|jgi:general secretion pathway protein K